MNTPPPNSSVARLAPAFDGGKRRAALFSLAMIGVMLWPIQENWRDDPRDDFPLSYYPMFTNQRDPIETFYYVVGQNAQGERYQVPYRWIGDGGGNQVRRQLRKIMNEGYSAELAVNIADRIAKRSKPPWSEVVSIAVCKGKYDVDAFYRGKKQPVSEKIYAQVNVERSKP